MLVGGTAVAAPILHSLTDLMEWYQNGFSATQLWLNYLAFLPMPWLLLGIYAVRTTALGTWALIGAVLHGFAFTYFAHTTLYALAAGVPDYESLWGRLGPGYSAHGALMVIGGLLFAGSAFRGKGLPRVAVSLFAVGLLVNLVLALAPAPDILQTVGTAVRNAGLVGIGASSLRTQHGQGAR
ncbi:MAG: hypothetical protein AB7Q16_17340 [Vicinamibacterales bacterium]